MEIKHLCRKEIEDALPMIWDTFITYEAPYYPENGKKAFWKAIHSQEYLDMLDAYGAFKNEEIVGIIATRNKGSHVALFFVSGNYHRRGVGKQLFLSCIKKNPNTSITVHSSLYAVQIYKHLGFVPSGEVQNDDGIQFVPMVYER